MPCWAGRPVAVWFSLPLTHRSLSISEVGYKLYDVWPGIATTWRYRWLHVLQCVLRLEAHQAAPRVVCDSSQNFRPYGRGGPFTSSPVFFESAQCNGLDHQVAGSSCSVHESVDVACKFLSALVAVFGSPADITSDTSSWFVSELFLLQHLFSTNFNCRLTGYFVFVRHDPHLFRRLRCTPCKEHNMLGRLKPLHKVAYKVVYPAQVPR